MSSLFNLFEKPEILSKANKIFCINIRSNKEEYLNWINIDTILNRLKEWDIDFIFEDFENENFENIKKIDFENQYKDYLKFLFFFNDAPKTKEEIYLIDQIKPFYIFWIGDKGYTLSAISYNRFKLKIQNEPEIPFTPFSTKVERFFLYNLSKFIDVEGEILEIGAYSGGTTIALGLGNKNSKFRSNIFSVDVQFQKDYDYFLKNVGVYNLVKKFKNDSKEFLHIFPELLKEKKLRILWIDGDHSYEGAKFDIEHYKKFISNEGVIVIHDYGINDSIHSGITRAVYESIVKDPDFSNFAKIGSIFYAEKKRTKKFLNFENITSVPNSPYNVFKWLNQLNYIKGKKLILYGAGLHTRELISLFDSYNKELLGSIMFIIDDYADKNFILNGKTVYNSEILKNHSLNYDYIIISSFDFEEVMLEKLKNLGIAEEKILPIYSNKDFINHFKRNFYPIISNINQIECLFSGLKNE